MSGQTITKSLVDGLEKQASEYTVWDSKLPGFGVRVRPTGAKSFIIVYRAGTGRTAPVRRYTVAAVGKLAPEAARTQAKILLGNIANGADPAAEKRASRPKRDQLTFDIFADHYIAEYVIGTGGKQIVDSFNLTGKWPAEIPSVNKKSWKNDVQYLKRPREEWGRLLAASITDDDVADLLDTIAEDAPVSANRTQSVLHKMFKWGMQPGRKYVPSNPLTGLERRGGKGNYNGSILLHAARRHVVNRAFRAQPRQLGSFGAGRLVWADHRGQDEPDRECNGAFDRAAGQVETPPKDPDLVVR
jgi:hypothetical protein